MSWGVVSSWREPSQWVRPMPDDLTPPHGHWAWLWVNEESLIQTEPTWRRLATSSPFCRSDVHTLADSP